MESKLLFVEIVKTGKKDVCQLIDGEYLSIDNINVYTPSEIKLTEPDASLYLKKWNYCGNELVIIPNFYMSGYIYLGMYTPDDEYYLSITVNLENISCGNICDRAFIDTNNNPNMDTWLIENGIAKYSGSNRESVFCSYPLMFLDYVLIYQLNPQAFEKAYFS